MKRLYFTLIALIATLVASAQTIKVYEYDSYGNLCSKPAYVSSKQVKVVFDDKSGVTDGYEWVDLGLPSGTLWATCNIGANSPEEYGDYFAWGETTPKDEYDWSNYKWCNGSEKTLTKYCYNSEYGVVDNKMILDPEDDAATVNWGSNWCMPTKSQITELGNSDYATQEFIIQNGVKGLKITSKQNGKSIFLPAAGYYDTSEYSVRLGDHQEEEGEIMCGGHYWTRDLYPGDNWIRPHISWDYVFGDFYFPTYYRYDMCGAGLRSSGIPVRPVRVKK